MNYSDKVPFDDLHTQIFKAVVEAMTARRRGDVLDKYDGNLECLKQNWEGFHLFEYVWAIRLKQDENGENLLDVHLDKNGIRGIDGLRKLAHDQESAFSKKKQKAEKVFESLAEFQDIPTLVCFSNFLEFCQKSYRPLDVFDSENKIPITIDGKRTIVTIDYAIKDIKRHVYFWEKSHKPPQPRLTIPQPKAHNDNYYANTVLGVIGRDEQKERLKEFLDCDLNVAWFQLAGEAGQGKSRLAFDLMHDASNKWGYRAGFLIENDIKHFRDHWGDWRPDQKYLLIFDYVIGREHEIKTILQTLVYNQDKFQHNKVRVLLLERQRWDQGSALNKQVNNNNDEIALSANIGNRAEWFLKLCEEDDFEGENLKSNCFDEDVVELKNLSADELVSIVKQLIPEEKLKISDKKLEETLERIDDLGRPLYAYLLAQQLNDDQENFQNWTKTDLLTNQLIRDKRRWQQAFKEEAPTWGDHHPAMKLAVLATIVREVKFHDKNIEEYFGIIDSPLAKEAIAITSGYLIKNDNCPDEIYALEPDLLGEWFVLYCFDRRLKFEELLDFAWQYWPKETTTFLQRITQDFIVLPKEFNNCDLTEKLLAYKPPHENHYQSLANVAVAIAKNLLLRNLVIPRNIIVALEFAAKLTDTFDMNNLAYFYYQGATGKGKGNSMAMCTLGFCYIDGNGVEQDLDKAIDLFQRAVKLGSSLAMNYLGICYQKGQGVEQDLDKAINLFQRAVKLGNSSAIFSLGVCYKEGYGVKQDFDKAINLYQSAIGQGNKEAMNNLGYCYQEGQGVEQNWDKAIDLYQCAVELGNSQAMNNLGHCHQKGHGVEQDWDKAIDLYQRAVELGNSQAINNLGLCYKNGQGVEQDWDKAISLFQRAVEKGDSIAMINLGYCYQSGRGVELDLDKAADLYQRAVEQGDSTAMVSLGVCYENGQGVEQDWKKAVDLYQRAVEQGVSTAMVNLGVCYENGQGVEQDWKKAVVLYQRAVEQGDSTAIAYLGLCYKNGYGIEQDLDKAIDLFQQAVEKGNETAMANLGICYQNGQGVDQDWDKAADLYHHAVEKGNSIAMANLGVCYHNGLGVEQDLDKAFDLYQRAVKLGNNAAVAYLGVCYQNGSGIEQDLNKAIDLYQRAADKNDTTAMFNLGVCYQTGSGVEQDLDKAIGLFQSVVTAGEKRGIDYIQNILLLQNFLSDGHDKTRRIKTWPNIKRPCLTEAPVFDPPIIAGNWKQLTAIEVTACLDTVVASFEILDLVGKLDGYVCQYARRLPLSFYKDCSLVDVQLYNPSSKNTFVFSAVFNTENAILLNGKSNIIHSLNQYLLAFNGNKSTIDYLQFFCSYVHGDNKPFQIISNLDEIPFKKEASQQIQDEIKEGFFSPRYIKGHFEKEGWQKFKAYMLYGDTLSIATFKVLLDGVISMEEDNPIVGELPILQRQYDGIFRTPLRSSND